MQVEAPVRATAQADAVTRVTTQADVPAPATTQADARTPVTSRADAPATHAFAPTSQTASPEELCGEARVRFVTGSSVLDAAARGRLDAYASCMASDPTHAVYISGTTDPGSDTTGIRLADARARAVADYLHEDGLHMAFEVRAYRAGAAGPVTAERHVGRTATATTLSPRRQSR